MVLPFFTGFGLGASLIIAIGAQNAFILRQGILRQHVFILCLICAVADAALIAVGVAGVGAVIERSPNLLFAIRIFGACFLFWYACMAIRRALNPVIMDVSITTESSFKAALATCLAFTFLNPHVYLDTVLLVGASAPQDDHARMAYGAGAMLASFAWFFSLGYGARLLEPLFKSVRAWQVLDTLIAIVMLLIAFSLIYPVLT